MLQIRHLAYLLGLISAAVAAEDGRSLHDMGFEQLLDLEVSTASRKEQPLSQTAAAAFVITREDIRRSGALSVPEALRLAPGVEVAQISPSSWSVSIRGFSGRFANKLLVLVDGRSVYTPTYAGVYWSMQDLMLEDVERIEVIRGPGATLWGANAVNGVINIITRNAGDTQGGLASARVGTAQSDVSARWGGEIEGRGHYRAYAKATRGESFDAPDGGYHDDPYRRAQLGFRADWAGAERDQFSLHGSLLRLRQGQMLGLPDPTAAPDYRRLVKDVVEGSGASLLGRWDRSLSAGSEISLQAYLDYYARDELPYEERRLTFDLDLQHRFAAGRGHDLVWGLGYRLTGDRFDTNPRYVLVADDEVTLHLFSAFVQDDVELIDDRFWLTLGAKVEHNDLTGVEWQPNVRVLWTPDTRHSAWASISRAVRTPSRGESGSITANNVKPPFSAQNPSPFPVLLAMYGHAGLDSETVIAYELGYRTRPVDNLTLDAALFYNDYDDVRTGLPSAPTFQSGYLQVNLPLANDFYGDVYGFELAADWRPAPAWRFQLAYSDQRVDMDSKSQPAYVTAFLEGSSPARQLSLRAGWTPRADLDLDLWLRAVDGLPAVGLSSGVVPADVDGYVALDLRAAWRPVKHVELALVGKNLLDARHEEYIREIWGVRTEVPRSVTATLSLDF